MRRAALATIAAALRRAGPGGVVHARAGGMTRLRLGERDPTDRLAEAVVPAYAGTAGCHARHCDHSDSSLAQKPGFPQGGQGDYQSAPGAREPRCPKPCAERCGQCAMRMHSGLPGSVPLQAARASGLRYGLEALANEQTVLLNSRHPRSWISGDSNRIVGADTAFSSWPKPPGNVPPATQWRCGDGSPRLPLDPQDADGSDGLVQERTGLPPAVYDRHASGACRGAAATADRLRRRSRHRERLALRCRYLQPLRHSSCLTGSDLALTHHPGQASRSCGEPGLVCSAVIRTGDGGPCGVRSRRTTTDGGETRRIHRRN